MEFELKIDGRSHTVSVPPADGGARRVVVDGRPSEVVERGGTSGACCVTIDGRRAVLHVARTPEGTWVSCGGRTRLVQPAEAPGRRGARRASGPGAGAVTPSFPSVVVAILVAVGDEVRENQPLVVVSAMKMEARLVAPRAGTVRAIRTAVGASVKPGDVLVDVAPAGGGAVDA